ncbi:MAG TPA: hypothetical protein PLP27_10100 [Crocinitomicaceae bacterium]|nr:hypothetical protein [Crocinitomicaceae bacterium]
MTTVLFVSLILIFLTIVVSLLLHIIELKITHESIVRQLHHSIELGKAQLKNNERKTKLTNDFKNVISAKQAQLNREIFDFQMTIFNKIKDSD